MRFEAGNDKVFPVLFIQIRQELLRASFFSLILFRICFYFFYIVSFDHVTSYFCFSCDDFDRLLCVRGKGCQLSIYHCFREQAYVSCQTFPKRTCAPNVTGRS